jgi:tetratricopeptide (TPR) repeat protein
LQSLLAARLDTLEPKARRLVADAAVLGGTFPAEALVAVSDQPEADVRRLLAELVRREVLGVRADPLSPQRGQYAFMQTMFRQVAYDTLSRRERKARHLAVAAHLKAAFADQGEEIAEVVAAHLLDALTAVPDDPDVPALRAQAVAMLTRAGERASRAGAPTAAAAAYATAANQVEQTEGPDSEIGAAQLRELAGVALLNVEPQLAADHYRRASETYARHERRRDTARADTGLARAVMRVGDQATAKELLRQALTVLEVSPDADTVEALSALAMIEAFAGNHSAAEQLSAAALAQAQALDSPDSMMSLVFKIRGDAHTFANRQAQAAANYREALRRAEAVEDSAALGSALLNLTNVLMTSDPRAATDNARAAVAHCRRVGSRYHLVVALSNLIHAFITTGDWAAAESTYAEAVEDDARLSEEPAFVWSTLLLHALNGDLEALQEALPVMERWSETQDSQEQSVVAVCKAAAHAARGEFAASLTEGLRSISFAAAISMASEPVWWGWSLASSAAIALGDFDEAGRLVDWLDEHPPGHISGGLRAERQRIRAQLLAEQDASEAGASFDSAVVAYRKFGSPYHLAAGLLDQAEYLVKNGDTETAKALVAEADSIVHRLGARPLTERARRLAGLLLDQQSNLTVVSLQP